MQQWNIICRGSYNQAPPVTRQHYQTYIPMNRPIKEAAVAAIILKRTIPEILVLKRVSDPKDPWSGQYAFPGGRRDSADADLLQTCKRETFEECGITLHQNCLVKQYPVRTAGNRMGIPTPVTTFLFEISARPE